MAEGERMTPEIRKYIKLILVMTTDFLMDAITFETYFSNLKMLVKNIEELKCKS